MEQNVQKGFLLILPLRENLMRHSKSWVISSKALIHHAMLALRWKEIKATYLFRRPVTVSNVLALLQKLKDLGSCCLVFSELLHLQGLPPTSRLFAKGLESLLNELDILDPKLFADDCQIADRVDITLDVNNLGIIEAANDLENGVDSTDVRQESITKASTSRGSTGQTGNIIDGQVRRNARLGLVLFT